jgi:hypothetical protein
VRRAVAKVKANYRAGNRRVYRPWIVEPGMWAQWDWGHGPKVAGRADESVVRLVGMVAVPGGDPDVGQDVADRDRLSRSGDARLRGGPTYWLTDNEKTVTTITSPGSRSGIPRSSLPVITTGSRSRRVWSFDPESKGGSESTVRIAKADLVPTDANLLDDYDGGPSWSMRARRSWSRSTNARTGSPAGRRSRCWPRNAAGCIGYQIVGVHRAFGETRKVSWSATISYGGVTYSVPHTSSMTRCGSESMVTRSSPPTCLRRGAVEVARHSCRHRAPR